jgi:hypothetical protein
MSVAPAAAAPSRPSAPPPFFHPRLTALAGAVVLALAAVVLWPASGVDLLERPEESLAQLVGREMELRGAIRGAPAWEQRLYAVLFPSDREARSDALRWYEEMAEGDVFPLAALHRLVLVAEDEGPAAALLDGWEPGDDWGRRLRAYAVLAYGPEAAAPEALRAALAAVEEELSPGWFADRLAARLAARLGDREAEARATVAVRARGGALLAAHRALLAGQALLVALGLVALAAPRRGWAGAGTAPLPPPWGGADGAGLFAWGALGLLGPAALAPLFPDTAWTRSLVSLASLVPLLACLAAYARARGPSVVSTFGLAWPRPGGALVRATVALVGVSTLLDLIVELAGAHLGLTPHWTDGFQEDLVWGSTDRVLTDVLDSVVVAPIVEELLFRGLLYGTLRRWLAPAPAALLSAAVFAVAHGYGVVGFAAVFTSGVLWAVAYERTRSLLPSILAHAAGNLLATGIVLLTLRP